MLGAIIGDIVGSRFEFNPTNDYNFELFGEGCAFTDDTICTIAVADALLKGCSYGESIHRWCRRYPNPMGGYGGRFRQWVMSDNPKPYGSFGNGSAMRVSPVAWWCDINDICREARKTAECTHSHEAGIEGAEAVAIAIYDCREMRCRNRGKAFSPEDILWSGLSHATYFYEEFPQNFKVDLDRCRNKFDETCQGTVPVALWIVMHSTSFEDAIRKAVSLGADADTLGAIVGSIAEALWGIPEWMKKKALSYLPQEIVEVVEEFHRRVGRLRKLTKRCEYYKIDDFRPVDEKHEPARVIEKEWATDLARSYSYADNTKAAMVRRLPMERWKQWAETYDLPLSLLGYIFNRTAKSPITKRLSVKRFEGFLEENYACRKQMAAQKKAQKQQKEQMALAMHWKLGLGNMGRYFQGENPLPSKAIVATADSWNTEPMPTDPALVSTCVVNWPLSKSAMGILRRGHIPDAMEDHWFMYADDSCIRYFRSWTGKCAFEAFYEKAENGYRIFQVKINRELIEFGINGNERALALLQYLLAAEIGANPDASWQTFITSAFP